MQCVCCHRQLRLSGVQASHSAVCPRLAPSRPRNARSPSTAWQTSRQIQQQASPSRHLVKRHAGPVDVMPTWTLDQIAGLAFGGLMAAFYFGAQQIDVYIAKQQRRELGLCEQCGGVYDPDTCKQDKCPLKAKSQ